MEKITADDPDSMDHAVRVAIKNIKYVSVDEALKILPTYEKDEPINDSEAHSG
jgi:hypothetical protein